MKKKHPGLYKFVKKLNRGLALGVLIVIVMTVWLSASAIKVKNEASAIRALTREYLVDMIEVSALMKSDTVGDRVSDASTKAMKDALGEIVDKYYTDSKVAQRACSAKPNRQNGTMLIDGLDSFVQGASVIHLESIEIVEKETLYDNGEVYYNYSFSPELKAGKYLDVWFSFEADVVYNTTDPLSFSAYPFKTGEYYGDKYVTESYPAKSETPEDAVYRVEVTVRLTGRITFVLEDGEWKIACTQSLNADIISQAKYQTLTKEVG